MVRLQKAIAGLWKLVPSPGQSINAPLVQPNQRALVDLAPEHGVVPDCEESIGGGANACGIETPIAQLADQAREYQHHGCAECECPQVGDQGRPPVQRPELLLGPGQTRAASPVLGGTTEREIRTSPWRHLAQ